MIDAAQHPGPAMWQGLMMIGAAIWIVWGIIDDRRSPTRSWWLAPSNWFLCAYTIVVTLMCTGIIEPPECPLVVDCKAAHVVQ